MIYPLVVWSGYSACKTAGDFVKIFHVGGYGGIGRRAGFRFQWETVQVRLLLSAGKAAHSIASFFYKKIHQLVITEEMPNNSKEELL